MKYALIKKGMKTVINVVDTVFDVPDDYSLIECGDDVQIGTIYENGEFVVPQTTVTLEEAKSAKLTEINAACDAILNAAISTYPETEVLTFDQQTSEANAYLASQNPADAPLLSALAAGRGITLDNLVQRVIAKHDAFSLLSGYVIGQRQALEDRLEQCQTVEVVDAIEVNIAIPDAATLSSVSSSTTNKVYL